MNKPEIRGLPYGVSAPPEGWRYVGTGAQLRGVARPKHSRVWMKGADRWSLTLTRTAPNTKWSTHYLYAVRIEDAHDSLDVDAGAIEREVANDTGCTPAEIQAAVYAETLRCIKALVNGDAPYSTIGDIKSILDEVDV